MAFDGTTELAQLDPPGDDVIAPWAQMDRAAARVARYGWRSGRALEVRGIRSGDDAGVTLDGDGRTVAPALMAQSGAVEVFVVSAGALSLVRFSPPPPAPPVALGSGAPPAPAPKADARVVWSTRMPAASYEAVRAAMGPASLGDARAVVVVAQAQGAVELHLLESAGDAPPRVRRARVADVRALPWSEPAARIAADGAVHVALVVASDERHRAVRVVDVLFPPGSGEGKPEVGPAVSLAGAPRAAAAAYPATTREVTPRTWAVLLQDGRVTSSVAPGEAHAAGRDPVLPLQLLPMSSATYMLLATPAGQLSLDVLH